jgi:hypothetical protein
MGPDRNTDLPSDNGGAMLTRRSLLRRASRVIAAAAFPRKAVMAAQNASPVVTEQPISPVMAKLSTYMSEARTRALPDEGVEKAKHHILDTVAAMVSGSELGSDYRGCRGFRERHPQHARNLRRRGRRRLRREFELATDALAARLCSPTIGVRHRCVET